MKLKDVITTGEVGKLLKVTTNTVAHWFDAGMLKGFVNPGSTARRITKTELEKFIKKYDVPLNRLQKEPFLSTAQCADLCYVTTNTLTKWIDSGMLHAFNLGSERRLVFYKDLGKFIKENHIPLIKFKEFSPPETGLKRSPRSKPAKPKKKVKKGKPKRIGRPAKTAKGKKS